MAVVGYFTNNYLAAEIKKRNEPVKTGKD